MAYPAPAAARRAAPAPPPMGAWFGPSGVPGLLLVVAPPPAPDAADRPEADRPRVRSSRRSAAIAPSIWRARCATAPSSGTQSVPVRLGPEGAGLDAGPDPTPGARPEPLPAGPPRRSRPRLANPSFPERMSPPPDAPGAGPSGPFRVGTSGSGIGTEPPPPPPPEDRSPPVAAEPLSDPLHGTPGDDRPPPRRGLPSRLPPPEAEARAVSAGSPASIDQSPPPCVSSAGPTASASEEGGGGEVERGPVGPEVSSQPRQPTRITAVTAKSRASARGERRIGDGTNGWGDAGRTGQRRSTVEK
jgi:hypothetical protein